MASTCDGGIQDSNGGKHDSEGGIQDSNGGKQNSDMMARVVLHDASSRYYG
jgi:hypothetical protein